MDPPCSSLSPETHRVFAAITQVGTGRTGIAKTTAHNLKLSLGLRTEALEGAVVELARACLLVKSEFDDADRLVLVGPRCECAPPRVGGGGRKSKSKSFQLEAVEADASMQPLSEPSAPQGLAPPRGCAPGTRPGDRRKAKGIDKGSMKTAYGLARYLNEEMTTHYFGQYPGGVNIAATAQNIASWLAHDGVDPATIKTMINTFVASPANFRKGIPIWKSFIARRQQWLAAAERSTKAREREDHRFDRDYWTRTTPVPKRGEEYWLGKKS